MSSSTAALREQSPWPCRDSEAWLNCTRLALGIAPHSGLPNLELFLVLPVWLATVIAVNLGSNPVDLDSGRSGKENNIRAFPSRF